MTHAITRADIRPTCPACGLVVLIDHGNAICGLGHDLARCGDCSTIHLADETCPRCSLSIGEASA